MAAEDPAVIERQMYLDLLGVSTSSLSLAELRDLTGGGVNARRAASAAGVAEAGLPGTVLTADISDSTAIGRALVQAASENGARATINAANATHGHVVTDLNTTGVANSTTYLRGDGVWATPTGGGSGGGGSTSVEVLPRALSIAAAGLANCDVSPFVILFAGDSLTFDNTWPTQFLKRLTNWYQPGTTPLAIPVTSNVGVPVVPATGIYGVNTAKAGASGANYMTNGNVVNMADTINPQLVFHGVGTNDFLGSGIPTGTYETALRNAIAAIDAVVSRPCVHVFHWFASLYQDKPYDADDYIAVMQDIVLDDPSTRVFIDFGPYADTLAVNIGDPYSLDSGDGIHLSAAGYRVWGDLMARAINSPPQINAIGYSLIAGDTVPPVAGTLTVVDALTTAIDVSVSGASDTTALHATPYSYSSDNGSTWSAWQSGATYTFTGLTHTTSYTLRHRVRDATGNVTVGTAVTQSTDSPAADVTPPTAGTWASSLIGPTGFTITVSGAADETALHASPYAFTTDNGATWSAYQTSNVWAATGLASSTGYTVNHRVRDAAGNVSTGTAATVTTGAATGTITDSFNRANDATGLGVADTGQSWSNISGVTGISGNAAYRVSGTAIAVVEFGAVDMSVSAKVTTAGDFFRLYARVVDASNWYALESSGTGTAVRLQRMVGGTQSGLGSSFAVALNDVVELRAKTNGANVDLSLLINGVNRVTVSQSGAQVLTGTKGGLGGVGASAFRLDDFSIVAA